MASTEFLTLKIDIHRQAMGSQNEPCGNRLEVDIQLKLMSNAI